MTITFYVSVAWTLIAIEFSSRTQLH